MSYRIYGNKLLHFGEVIELLGSNWIGMELQEHAVHGPWGGVTYGELISQMKQIGLNSVRLPITHETIKNVPVKEGDTGASWISGHYYLKGKKSMEVCDALIDELESHGMRYIFDLHYLENGKIPAKWYTAKYTESMWLNDLYVLAERYKGRPGFVGIDLKNEPNKSECTWGSGDPKTDWKMATEKAFSVIDSVNKDIIVLVEAISAEGGVEQLLTPKPNIPADRVSYSVHLYGPDVWEDFGEGFKASTFPVNMPEIWDRMLAYQKVNVIVGEWGGKYGSGRGGEKDKIWQDAFAKYLKSRNLSSFYWGWTDSSGWDTGGIQTDGGYRNLHPGKVSLIKSLISKNTKYLEDLDKEPPPSPEPKPIPEPPEIIIPPIAPVEEKPLDNHFSPGDIVMLRSGSPHFTVEASTPKVTSVYYFSESLERAELPTFLLKRAG